MDEQEKVAICKAVAHAVMIDRHITDAEHDLLAGLMAHYGLSDAQRSDVMNRNFGEDLAAVVGDLSEAASAELLEQLAIALYADGELHPAERQVIDAVAKVLSIAPERVERALVKAASNG